MLIALLSGLTSCVNTVRPPAGVTDPATVYLVDHGRTPSLVMPTRQGTMVRYAYGHWKYYALRRNDLFTGIGALLWPSQATLGRGEMPGPLSAENLQTQMPVGYEHLYPLVVERSSVDALQAQLDQAHRDQADTMVINESYGMAFVHHPERYSYFHNSNHAMADWLRELDVEVDGPAFGSNWKIVPDCR